METLSLHRPGDLVCLKDTLYICSEIIAKKTVMKQYYFTLLILINVHHTSHLNSIKIQNPWNLRFQALTAQNHDILKTEYTSFPSVQQFFLKHPGVKTAEASVW